MIFFSKKNEAKTSTSIWIFPKVRHGVVMNVSPELSDAGDCCSFAGPVSGSPFPLCPSPELRTILIVSRFQTMSSSAVFEPHTTLRLGTSVAPTSMCHCFKVGDLVLIQCQHSLSRGDNSVPFLYRDPSVCSSLPYLGNILVNHFVHIECWSILARVKIR